jgi:hypothetical protein
MADREPGNRDLLSEWRRVLDAAVSSAAGVGRAEIPREVLGALRRQLELGEAVLERERRLAGWLAAPVDTVFDLLEETALILRRQSEALESAGRALEETAGLFRRQAEMFERSIGTLRQPAELAKAAAGLERRPTRGGAAGGTATKTPPEPAPAPRAGAGSDRTPSTRGGAAPKSGTKRAAKPGSKPAAKATAKPRSTTSRAKKSQRPS